MTQYGVNKRLSVILVLSVIRVLSVNRAPSVVLVLGVVLVPSVSVTRLLHVHLPPWSLIQSIKCNVGNWCLCQLVGKQPARGLPSHTTF